MGQARSFSIATVILIILLIKLSNGQTCYNMWDPIFEVNSNNPPTMCTGK
jgi:hypothetical protein